MDTTPILRDIDDPEAALGQVRLLLHVWADELTKQAEADGVILGPGTVEVRKQILGVLRDLLERKDRVENLNAPARRGIRWPDEYNPPLGSPDSR